MRVVPVFSSNLQQEGVSVCVYVCMCDRERGMCVNVNYKTFVCSCKCLSGECEKKSFESGKSCKRLCVVQWEKQHLCGCYMPILSVKVTVDVTILL